VGRVTDLANLNHLRVAFSHEGQGLNVAFSLCPVSLPRHKLSLCTNALRWYPPNEIAAWLEYHFLYGVEHVYLFDRFGEYMHSLKQYEEEKRVTVIQWRPYMQGFTGNEKDGENFDQIGIVNVCIWRYRTSDEWMMHLDPDEYLHMPDTQVDKMRLVDRKGSLVSYLTELDPQKHELVLKSVNFVGEQTHPALMFTPYPFVKSHMRNGDDMGDIRTKWIARTEQVKFAAVHYICSLFDSPSWKWLWDESRESSDSRASLLLPSSEFRINHYRAEGADGAGKGEVPDLEATWALDLVQGRLAKLF